MSVTLGELAQIVSGELHGEASLAISGAATLQTAREGEITLADNPKLAEELTASPATAVVVADDFRPDGIPYILVDQVHEAFAKIVCRFRPPRPEREPSISPQAYVSPEAQIGRNVDVQPGAFIDADVVIGDDTVIHPGVRILGGCRIGSQVTLFPNVVLYENTVVGDRGIIHGGAVIGAYGFGYNTTAGRHQLSAQLGYVELGPDVEIGACSTVDRGTYGPTLVGEGTKVDNQVMIAHNCRIGKHNLLCSHVGIAGSSTTGDYVVMAGQVGVGDHIKIGSQVILGAKAGVMNHIKDGETQLGIPATPIRQQMVKQAALAKLPEMRRQLRELQRKIEKLETPPSTGQQEAA